MSNDELRRLVSIAALRLQDEGVHAGDKVLLETRDCAWRDYAVLYLAVLSLGASPVSLPADEGCDPAGVHIGVVAKLAITGDGAVRFQADATVARTALLTCDADPTRYRPAPVRGALTDVLFTSGTTGVPRMIESDLKLMFRHWAPTTRRSVPRIVHAFAPGTKVGTHSLLLRSRFAGFTPVNIPWTDAATFLTVAAEANPAALFITPTMLRSFLALTSQVVYRQRLQSIQAMFLVGEPVDGALLAKTRCASQRTSLFVTYALTEAHGLFFSHLWSDDAPQCVGRPPSGCAVRIEDEQGRICATDVAGRIVLSGDIVGHLPIRTSDMGRLDRHGRLHVLGRIDKVINVGGHKVDPQVIRNVLLEFPGVIDVEVRAIDDRLLGQLPAATIVSREPLDLATVREHCRRWLPRNARPSHISIRTDTRLTPSLKTRQMDASDRIS